jgi:hypothetical protein
MDRPDQKASLTQAAKPREGLDLSGHLGSMNRSALAAFSPGR